MQCFESTKVHKLLTSLKFPQEPSNLDLYK